MAIEPIDMLDVAKKLIPGIEENMPSAVREAFEGGKVKSIFRTGFKDLDPETGLRSNAFGGPSAMPSSHYFLLDDGRAARYGTDDFGHGWMGARASVPTTVMTQDDPFVFDKILFGDSGEAPFRLGDDISKSLPSGVSSDPIVGKNIFETFSKDGKVTNYHGGNTVKDIYGRDGTATFFDDAVNPVRGTKPNLITSAIEDLNFVEKRNTKGKNVMVPELKPGSVSAPATVVPTPTSATAPPVSALPDSKLRGTALNPTPAAQPPASNLRGTALNPTPAPQPPNFGTRPVIDNKFRNQTVIHGPVNVPYEFEPKIGKQVMEFWSNANHPGHDIHVLHDVAGKSSTDINDLLGTMDKRVLQGMPAEVSSAIDSGDISHIFRTNPEMSQAFQDLPKAVQDSLGGPENTGSIYFRKKTGETARWKLPEIGTNDKGWNANKGSEIFSAATAYPDDTYPVTRLNGVTKVIGQPNAAHALEQSLESELQPHGYNLSKANIERIRSGNPNILGSEALGRIPQTPPAVPSVATTPPQSAVATETYDHGAGVSKSTASGETLSESPPPKSTRRGPIDIGKPVDDIRTIPSSRGADAASGGSVTPSGTPHNVSTTQNLTTKNTNPTTTQPKAQAKINSQTTASGANISTNRPAGPGATQKAKGLLDDGLKTAQDLAGGNARLMGIAGIAGLLGVGVASSRNRTKQNPAPDRGTYMDRSRQDLDY
jgi:hypothetical protein